MKLWGNFRLTASAAVIVLALALLYGFHHLLPEKVISDPDGIVILVRNKAVTEDAGGKQVLCGLAAAIATRPKPPVHVEMLQKCSLPPCEGTSEEDLRQKRDFSTCVLEFDLAPGQETGWNLLAVADRLTRELVRQPVLGVISDGSSLTDPAVVEVCYKLRVPLLLTSATDDGLLPQGGSMTAVFRLPANNSKQAEELGEHVREWCKNGLGNAAILYETNTYGEGLYQGLLRNVSAARREPASGNGTGEAGSATAGCQVYGFRVTPTTELALLIPRLAGLGVKHIVFLGYSDNAYDLLLKLKSYDWEGELVLSDGSYSKQVQSAAHDKGKIKVAIAFPVDLSQGPDRNLYQFGAFGHDAWVLLDHLRSLQSPGAEEIRHEFRQIKADEFAERYGKKVRYSFDESGENQEPARGFKIQELSRK